MTNTYHHTRSSGEVESATKITDKIVIGNIFAATSPNALNQFAICAVLALTDVEKSVMLTREGMPNPKIYAATKVKSIKVHPLKDGEGNSLEQLNQAVKLLTTAIKSSSPVMVACHAGRSRSVLLVATYLAKVNDTRLDEELQKIAEIRKICPTESLKRNFMNILG